MQATLEAKLADMRSAYRAGKETLAAGRAITTDTEAEARFAELNAACQRIEDLLSWVEIAGEATYGNDGVANWARDLHTNEYPAVAAVWQQIVKGQDCLIPILNQLNDRSARLVEAFDL